MLLGMYVLDLEILFANNVTKKFQVPLSGWSMPVERKFEHLNLYCGAKEVLYTKAELVKLHKHVGHPSIGKLYEVINRARLNKVDESTRKLVEDINRSFAAYQKFSAAPQRFRATDLM